MEPLFNVMFFCSVLHNVTVFEMWPPNHYLFAKIIHTWYSGSLIL